MTDALIDALVALDAAERAVQTAKARINEAIIAQAERGPVVIPATTHDFAAIRHAAPFCNPEEPDA